MNVEKYGKPVGLIASVIFVLSIWTAAYGLPISLGITGDITVLRLFNYAQKWQTLIAALVAIGGAAFRLSRRNAYVSRGYGQSRF